MDTKNELYLEYARCINMCKGTDVKPWECVLAKLADGFSLYRRENMHPVFDRDPEIYKFAIFILEGKPVFPGDILYLENDVRKCEVCIDGYRIENDRLTDLFVGEDWYRYVPGVRCGWSWNPPKKKEYIINVPFASKVSPGQEQKQTFTVNGVALPCPTSTSLSAADNLILIRSGSFAQYFGFESIDDANLVALELMKVLMTAFEEKSKS